MGDIEEDRIYADTLGKTDLYVATGLGVAAVSVSNDRIGQFNLAHRCSARDIAADGTRLLVATDEAVLAIETAGDALAVEELGFGAAVAVGAAETPLAAAPDGTVARYDGSGWTELGTVETPRAIDGPLVASAEGVFRVEDGLDHVGLDEAYDVVGSGTPYAATDDGLYRLGPGWTRDLDGAFRVVTAPPEGSPAATLGHEAHAATTEVLYGRTDGSWAALEVPTDERIVDVAYVTDGEHTSDDPDGAPAEGTGGGVIAVTESGTCLVDPVAAKDGARGWRARSLGLPETAGMAVPDQ